MTTTHAPSTSNMMDEAKVTKIQWRMVLTAGMGFFTDAYDLFIIGTVTTLLAQAHWGEKTFWGSIANSHSQVAWLNGGALIAAALGAIFFGYCSDKFGRIKMYGIEVLILFFGAILSAISLSYSFPYLLITRIFVGFGIGGDYPSSAVVASEHANTKNRGYLVLLVFGMQALGLIAGPLIASLLLWLRTSGVFPELSNIDICRILLGLGAVPAMSVFYLRRKLSESRSFARLQNETLEKVAVVSRVVSDYAHKRAPEKNKSNGRVVRQKLLSKKWFLCLIGTAGAWFLLDVAFYGNGISTLMILNKLPLQGLPGDKTLLTHTLCSALMFLVCAFPGYILAAKYVDRIGRKPLQIGGFIMLALCYGAIVYVPSVTETLPLFILIFGSSFFFTNFGPNTTTFLIPSEVFPTNIRAKGHGISAAVGKLGAFAAAFGFPFLLLDKVNGVHNVFLIAMIASLLGCAMTFLVPEMKKKSIDHMEEYE